MRLERPDSRLERPSWWDQWTDKGMNESPPMFYRTLSPSKPLPKNKDPVFDRLPKKRRGDCPAYESMGHQPHWPIHGHLQDRFLLLLKIKINDMKGPRFYVCYRRILPFGYRGVIARRETIQMPNL